MDEDFVDVQESEFDFAFILGYLGIDIGDTFVVRAASFIGRHTGRPPGSIVKKRVHEYPDIVEWIK